MVIAYHMSIHDDGTHMLGPETYRVPRDAGYYDWRFGIGGAPHPATCPTCGRKTDPDFINPQFRVRCRKRDLTMRYDGYVLVSARFREFCESNNWHQYVHFCDLPADDEYSFSNRLVHLKSTLSAAERVLKTIALNVATSSTLLVPHPFSCATSNIQLWKGSSVAIWNLLRVTNSRRSSFLVLKPLR